MRKIIIVLPILSLLFYQCKLNESNNKEGQILLDSLKHRCYVDLNSPGLLDAAQSLEKEALKQNNDLYLGYAYAYFLKYYHKFYNKEGVSDSVRLYGEKAKTYLRKADELSPALQVEGDLIRWEVRHENLENTFVRIFDLIREAESIGNKSAEIEAYSTLGWAYLMSNSPKEALNAFQKELQLLKSTKSKEEAYILSNYLAVYSELAQTAITAEETDLGLAYCDSLRFYFDKYSERSYETKGIEITPDILTLEALIIKNDLQAAKPFADKLLVYCNTIADENRPQLYYDASWSLAVYYLYNKEYDKALSRINEVLEFYTTSSDYELNFNNAKNQKSDILAGLGRFQEAYQLKDETKRYRDSIGVRNATRQISEMYTQYNVDKLEREAMENEAKARYANIVVVSLIIVSCLLFVITLIIKRNSDKLKKKNEKIFAQIRDMDRYRKEISKLSLKKEENDTPQEPSLFEKIEKYLRETHCYIDSDLSREALALQLGTNRQYLTQAIQENVSMTFSEYINHYRLEYTRHMLVENSTLSVEDIYTSAGFSNKSTFYRLFKDKYDLTPKELRELALEEVEK